MVLNRLRAWWKKKQTQWKRKRKNKAEYSKSWLTKWQYFSMFWISVYLSADIYYNQAINAKDVVLALITSIIVVMIPYFVKAYLGKKAEEETRIKELMMQQRNMEEEEL